MNRTLNSLSMLSSSSSVHLLSSDFSESLLLSYEIPSGALHNDQLKHGRT
jgi:hypothetical protein